MGRDISIAISAKDNFTQAITTMRNANQNFRKDLTGLTEKLNELNKTKITLKVDVDKAKKELQEAEKQFSKTGDAADKLKLELANANYENARRNLALVSDNAKQAEKDIRNLTGAISKAENRAGRTGSIASAESSALSKERSILSTLGASGATSFIGNILSDVAKTQINSAFGSEIGTIASSIMSSTSMGAAIGTAIAPGIGTAIGALGGAALGYIQGQNQVYENKDEAFKSYYQDLYNSVLEKQEEALKSGSDIAASRETDKISFATLLGGDDNANKFLADLTKFAETTPFEYDDLTTISKTLLAYSYKQEEILPLLAKVGDAGSALGMSKDDMKYVATALGRMKTTGKATMEYLNPLLERGIDVWSYLAQASGKTKKEVQEMVSKGLVPGEKAAEAIADYMGYNFAGNMEKQSQTFSGLVSTLEDSQTALENAMGEGYNNTRKIGLQEQIDWLSGESGNSMQEAYNKIGQWKASLENLAEQYQRDAINAVMKGTVSAEFSEETQTRLREMYQEYTRLASDKSEEAGAKMGALLAEAQAIATNEYNASEGAQLALQSNMSLAESIRNDTALNEAYWDTGYRLGQELSKGLAAAIQDNTASVKESIYQGAAISIKSNNEQSTAPVFKPYTGKITVNGKAVNLKGHAYGLSYVPYDNYPALLHEGERVLTASENRNYGANTPINITGNNFYVHNQNDINEVAKEIVRLINQAYTLAP